MGRFALKPNQIAAALVLVGILIACVGIGFIFWPAALIVGGAALTAVGLFGIELDQ